MASVVRILLVLAAGLLADGASARGQAPAVAGDDATRSDQWRNAQRCGINAAYVFLGLQDIKADYEWLLHRIGVGDRGSTLKDLRIATSEAGLPTVVAKTTLEGLARTPMPVVAHMERQSSSEFSRDPRGHYVVVLSVNDRMVRYVDGTTGSLTLAPRLDFTREWTGYVLAAAGARQAAGWPRPPWLGVAAAGLFSAVAWGALFLACRASAARGRGVVAGLGLVLVTAAGTAAAADDPPKPRPVPTVAEVRAEIEAQRARTTALLVSYATKQTALAEPAILVKYLNKLYLRNDRIEDAFKGPKRFHKVSQPSQAAPIAPLAPPEVDPNAPPAIRENQERLRKAYEDNAAKTKASAKAPGKSEKITFQPEEAWAYNGNGLDLKRLIRGLSEVHDYRKDGTRMVFQSGYLQNVGWEPDDPTFPKAAREVRNAMTLPGVFSVFQYKVKPTTETVEDGSVCVVLTGRGTLASLEVEDKLWLDLDHGLMLRRHELAQVSDGTIGLRVVADEPKSVPGAEGIYLPGRCRFFEFAPPYAPANLKGKGLAQTEMTLLESKANDLVPDSLFELTAPPGTLVNNYRMGNEIGLQAGYPVEFVVPADANKLDSVINQAQQAASRTRAQSSGSRWLIMINLAGVVVLALVIAGRRFLRRKPQSTEGPKS